MMIEMEPSESDDSSCCQEPLLPDNPLIQTSTHLGSIHTTTYNRREGNQGNRRPLFMYISDFAEPKLHPQSIKLQELQKSEQRIVPTRLRELLFGEESQERRNLLAVLLLVCILLSIMFNASTAGLYDEQHRNESSYPSVPKIVVLSPEIGYLDVIGTTHHICDHDTNPELEFECKDLSVSLGSSETKFIPSSIHHTSEFRDGILLIARVLIGRQNWKAILESSKNDSSTPIATIVDKKYHSVVDKPVWIDPSLSKYYLNNSLPEPSDGRSKHFLAAMLTLPNTAVSEEYLQSSLLLWLEHYRRLGVGRFYIIDNNDQPSVELPPEESEGVAYIHFPDQEVACNGTKISTELLQNAILKAVNVEWVLLIGLDDFVIPATNNTLPSLVQSAIQRQDAIASLLLPSRRACGYTSSIHPDSLAGRVTLTDLWDQMGEGEDIVLVRTSLVETYQRGTPTISSNQSIALDAKSQAWVAKACAI